MMQTRLHLKSAFLLLMLQTGLMLQVLEDYHAVGLPLDASEAPEPSHESLAHHWAWGRRTKAAAWATAG